MKIKIAIMCSAVVFSPSLLAGDINSLAGPSDASSAMYTIEDIYNRLNDGTEGVKRSAFAESTAVPASTGKTLDEVMSKAPAKDNTNGAEPSDVATGKTYWGLTDANWGLKTGTASTPSCTRNSSANPVFTDNGDGTVTDNRTCLIWLKDADCVGQRVWADVDTSAEVVTLINAASCDNYTASFNDWRLPTIQELASLVHYGYYNPAISNFAGDSQWQTGVIGFSGVQTNDYWSSSTSANYTTFAWYLYLFNGNVYSSIKADAHYVWPVRGGQ
ncbi:Lcl C-terminal domain-containing protein [Candidatus Marithrix sp. Canyon 246]|uniref:Lcl C-terminal domain-containing protein n=1 Tax=Candidatus Marithrix sp. Canyon 246 TaxID=1827136 RepID=UPI000849FBD6|nr:DUF1566 domain-containing protein [Candidatus Marithrix sp. Canyon 246]